VKKVCVVGSGYVGLVTGACLSEIGHTVVCTDKDASKIETLNAGGIPIYEAGLAAIVKKNRKKKRLSFTTDLKKGIQSSDIIFVAVNTPPMPDGGADLSYVEASTREIAQYANKYKLLVEKSTVPVQTGDRIMKTLSVLHKSKKYVEVASNPEFLREGTAVRDFLNPDRVVVGVQSKKAEKILRELYAKIKAPFVVTDIKSAELIKHASNSFLAMKISYINSIAQICESVGADISQVALGMGLDKRIGKSFLNAGIGYGGSCFPKDVSAFIKIAEKNGFDFGLLKSTMAINQSQRDLILKKLEEVLWTFKNKIIGVWGLSFKPETDDLRNAPSLDIIKSLLKRGAQVQVHDPVAMEKMRSFYPDIAYCDNPSEAADGADGLLLLTEWNVYRKASLSKIRKKMKTPVLVDGRNVFSPEAMKKLGFTYRSIGRMWEEG